VIRREQTPQQAPRVGYDGAVSRAVVAVLALVSCAFRHGAVFVDDGGEPGDASAWAHSRILTIDNAGLEPLANFAVLVALDPSRIDYSSASPTGADLRFRDDTGTQLAYEIESWSSGGSSPVWVAVPAIPGNATTTITMYYGNPNATDAQDPAAVWDGGFVGVWHVADAHDSTGKHASTNHGGTTTTGMIGPAQAFDGTSTYLDTGASEYLGTFTIECWMFPNAASITGVGASGPLSRGLNYQFQWNCTSGSYCKSANYQWTGGAAIAPYGDASPQQWSYVVGTYDGTVLQSYLDGIPQNFVSSSTAPGDDTGVSAKLGARDDFEGYFAGRVDEARISSIARPESYVVANERSMSDTYITFGPQQ